MCELMGLCLEHPITADFSFREFGGRDQQNADGWGLAWYPDQSAALIKEPVSWRTSAHSEFLEGYRGLRSSIYVAHVRHQTVGGLPTHADTHPFLRELGGKDYVFAHNGTLTDLPPPEPEDRFHPLGSTDSERAFCLLLERMARAGRRLETRDDYGWLHAELQQLNEHGKLNCILTDGRSLVCYRDSEGRGGLTRCELQLPADQARHFADGEVAVAVQSPDTVRVTMVATYPLNDNHWEPLAESELLVMRGGRSVFTSHGEPSLRSTG